MRSDLSTKTPQLRSDVCGSSVDSAFIISQDNASESNTISLLCLKYTKLKDLVVCGAEQSKLQNPWLSTHVCVRAKHAFFFQ